jgi:hypothetical protein
MQTKLVVVAVTNTETGEVRRMGYFGQPELVDAITAGAKDDETALVLGEFEVSGLIACSLVNREDAEAQGLLDPEDDDEDTDNDD